MAAVAIGGTAGTVIFLQSNESSPIGPTTIPLLAPNVLQPTLSPAGTDGVTNAPQPSFVTMPSQADPPPSNPIQTAQPVPNPANQPTTHETLNPVSKTINCTVLQSLQDLYAAVDMYLAGGTNQSYVEATYGPIEDWDTSRVTSMARLFDAGSLIRNSAAASFNANISLWNVSQVTDMNQMFEGATAFNHDVSQWDTGQVTDMRWMFADATTFNQDMSQWNVSQVTLMEGMFWNAEIQQ